MNAVIVIRLPEAEPDDVAQTARAVGEVIPAGCTAVAAINETADRILAECPGLE